MDHYIKVILGTLLSSALLIAFFWFFDKMYKKHCISTGTRFAPSVPIILKNDNFQNSKFFLNNGSDRLIYEEYAITNTVVCLFSDSKSAVGVCLFAKDLYIEYFTEVLPKYYKAKESLKFGWILQLIHHWAEKWQLTETSIHLILDDKDLVTFLNSPSSVYFNKVLEYEELMGLKLIFHWNENYFSDEGFNNELWDDLIYLVKKIKMEGDKKIFWQNFVCGHWNRTRITLKSYHHHNL